MSTTIETNMPPALLALLYAGGVVAIPSDASAKQVTFPDSGVPQVVAEQEVYAGPAGPAAVPFAYFGQFGSQVLILVKDENALHVSDDALELLTKILSAVKTTLADVAIVNLARHSLNFDQITAVLKPSVALFYGVSPSDLGVPLVFPPFQVQRWAGIQFLQAPSLQEMLHPGAAGIQYKKQLWEALQKIFDVKGK